MPTPLEILLPLLEAHRGRLVAFVRSAGRGLQDRESAEDLAQGVHAQVLQVADRFEYRGEAEFTAWLFALARQHLADRQRYWRALRRDGGAMLRLTFAPRSESPGGTPLPATSSLGPASRAERREQLQLAAKVLALLSPRDQQLVKCAVDDVALEEVARRLGLGYEAAKRARQRALERFKSTYDLLFRRDA